MVIPKVFDPADPTLIELSVIETLDADWSAKVSSSQGMLRLQAVVVDGITAAEDVTNFAVSQLQSHSNF